MNDTNEANLTTPAQSLEKLAQEIKHRKREAGEVVKRRGRPRKAFVEVESIPQPKVGPIKVSRRDAGLPDPKWMAEFVKALLGLL